ncbi:uncharacterized protein zbtb38 isoform X3 [Syngnathoides biaculeatus]|uniref:uncharacterized protein zbtb38 isoform X3 n=1 Tax=Syngnathoides biaculeatus TaxID=300417 RepID=UPI002ADDC250|nr:uncharacterized protein zbtb38 isoform X3 [Syngnathoides biaculeatus]
MDHAHLLWRLANPAGSNRKYTVNVFPRAASRGRNTAKNRNCRHMARGGGESSRHIRKSHTSPETCTFKQQYPRTELPCR